MISEWIASFTSAWLHKDIPAVQKIFSEDVEYWESPFQRVASKDLPVVWAAILAQENIGLNVECLMSEGKNHVLRWDLTYNRGEETYHWAGVYLVRLNDNGMCEYFYQVGEKV